MLGSLQRRLTRLLTEMAIRMLYKVPQCTHTVGRCPVCGAAPDRVEFTTTLSPLDRCGECGHVYTRQTPGEQILRLMYGGMHYWEQDKKHQGITAIEHGPHWSQFVALRMNVMRNAGLLEGGPKTVFEIGCSEGILLRELSRLGHEASGSELNASIARAGMQALGVRIHTGLFEEIPLPVGYFDAIISFHTIEHIVDLDRTFTKIARMLKPGGIVLVEVPTGPEEYANRDHMHFFSDASLRRLLDRYFEAGETITNGYQNSAGIPIGSLYGIGRRPRMSATR